MCVQVDCQDEASAARVTAFVNVRKSLLAARSVACLNSKRKGPPASSFHVHNLTLKKVKREKKGKEKCVLLSAVNPRKRRKKPCCLF